MAAKTRFQRSFEIVPPTPRHVLNRRWLRCNEIHGPFYTKEIDLWIEATTENAQRAFAALAEFGAPMADLTVHDLTQPHVVFQFGMVPSRVDVLTTIDGVTFAEAWKDRVETRLDDIAISMISLHDLIRNKEAANRPSDHIHLESLRKYGKQKQ